ncbi:MAG TPA: hypothetical protein VGO18_32060, partial [Steroidobacteraceae bacterium]|nr:hypothetical protein [Steroidobacteraceae bacterium]
MSEVSAGLEPVRRAGTMSRLWRFRAPGRRRVWYVLIVSVVSAVITLAIATRLAMRDLPDDLESLLGTTVKSQVLARDGTPLSYTLANSWNATDVVPLARIPALLQTAFVVAEDQHF